VGLTKQSNWGSVGNNWSVHGVSNNSLSSVQSVGSISNNSGVGSESLALSGGSVLSLEGLADRLVADLTVSVSVDWLVGSIVDWGNSGSNWSVGNWGNNSVGSMSNNGGSVHGMSGMDDWGSVHSVGNNWSSVHSMSNWVSNNWSWGVGRSWGISWSRGSLVSWSGLVGLLLWVDSGSSVGDISDKSIISIAGVGHSLDSAIGKSDRVRSLDIAGTIRGLLSVEVGLGVVIGNGVGVSVGGDLISILLSLVGRSRGMVSRGSMGNNWSWGIGGSWGISWSSVHGVGNNRSSVDSVGNNWGSMHSVMGNWVSSMSNNWSSVHGVGYWGNGVEGDHSRLANWDGSVGSDGWLNLRKSLGVIHLGDGGVSGTESFGLDKASLFSMGGGDRLVRGLSSSNSDMVSWVSQEDRAGGEGRGSGQN